MPQTRKRSTDAFDRLPFTDRAAWRRWLQKHHSRAPGLWLVFYKKGSGKPSVRYDEAVEEALCFGWIDSLVKSLDTERYIQLFTPRRPKSAWSATNKARVERLIASGAMTRAGLEKIELARSSGSWTRLDSVAALEVPPDFRKALAANRKARANFERFTPGKKKQLLYLINSAKRPETRQKKIAEAVILAAEARI